jgi:hypothetical protein
MFGLEITLLSWKAGVYGGAYLIGRGVAVPAWRLLIPANPTFLFCPSPTVDTGSFQVTAPETDRSSGGREVNR